MTEFIATLASDADLMPDFLAGLGRHFPSRRDGESVGVGFYQDDHALTIRKPREILSGGALGALTSSVKSRIAIVSATTGVPAVMAPPLRFRRWLFASAGSFGSLDPLETRIRDALPSFMRSEFAEARADKLAFGMFLRLLHERNLLTDPAVDARAIAAAMSATFGQVDALVAEAGLPVPTYSVVVTNGRAIFVARRGGPPVLTLRKAGLEITSERAESDLLTFVEALRRFRAVVFAAGATETDGPGWSEIPPGRVLYVDKSLELRHAD